MPSGAIDDWGRSPSLRAASFGLRERSSSPSSRTVPVVGRSRRANPRSRVDLPHAFGPMMIVNELSGTSSDRSETMGVSP